MNTIYSIFVFLVWFLSTYFVVVFFLILFEYKDKMFTSPPIRDFNKLPKVTLLVPAFNEGESIKDSIDSLKKIDYPRNKLEIIFINDGSSDDTAEIIKEFATEKYMTFIDNKKNKGKAACLNQGILQAKGELIGTMDADSEVSPDVLLKTIPYFYNDKMGAVTITVKVKDPKTILQKMVEIEYIIGLSIALKLFSFFNALHVTPGPFSLYRKKIFDKIGLFDINNITEDHEIACRIQKFGYKIANCTTTCVYTITPADFKTLYKQRKRWYTGTLNTIHKHKDMLFKKEYGVFSYTYPYSILLTALGLLLFMFSTYLAVSTLFKKISFYHLTNFNFLAHFKLFQIDLLNFGLVNLLALFSIWLTIISAIIYLKFAKTKIRTRLPGFIGFVFMFIFYQFFWAMAYYAIIFKKKIKWR